MQTATDFRFNVFNMMSSLIYARLVHPCSKAETYEEVIPKLFDTYDYSLISATQFVRHDESSDGLSFSKTRLNVSLSGIPFGSSGNFARYS